MAREEKEEGRCMKSQLAPTTKEALGRAWLGFGGLGLGLGLGLGFGLG